LLHFLTEILRRNYELKLQNDDYKGMEPGTARRDFIERVKAYEAAYEPIEDEEDDGNIAYVKVINVGQKTVTRLCTGYVPSQVGYLLAAHKDSQGCFRFRLAFTFRIFTLIRERYGYPYTLKAWTVYKGL
jgi:hypothetical protein